MIRGLVRDRRRPRRSLPELWALYHREDGPEGPPDVPTLCRSTNVRSMLRSGSEQRAGFLSPNKKGFPHASFTNSGSAIITRRFDSASFSLAPSSTTSPIRRFTRLTPWTTARQSISSRPCWAIAQWRQLAATFTSARTTTARASWRSKDSRRNRVESPCPMATFIVDTENNIAAHAEVPASSENLQSFASEKELAKLAGEWPGSGWSKSGTALRAWRPSRT